MTDQGNTKRRRRWPIVVLAIILIALGIGGWRACVFFSDMNRTLADMYAAVQVSGLITNYIEENDKWPAGWDDLETVFEETYNRPQGAGEIEYLQQRIEVDWSADLESLRAADSHESPPFPVVRCYSGAPPGPTDIHDANLIIYEYMQYRDEAAIPAE